MYLDPGAGSVILQIILAAVLGVGVFIRVYWGKIRSLLRLNKKESGTAHERSAE